MTALAGLDYTAVSGTLTIDAGQATGTITVEVVDDGVIEGDDETFTVELSGANGATIVDGEGLGTIEDDDAVEPPPELPTLGDRQCDGVRGRGTCGVHGDAEHDERAGCHGGVQDRERDGAGGFGLHGCERDADD